MFAKQNRLPRAQRLTSAKIISHPYFSIRFQPNMVNKSRFAVVVSKKIDQRAVVRNRVRRLIQQALQQVGFKKDVDLLVVVKKSCEQESSKSIATLLYELFQKEGLA